MGRWGRLLAPLFLEFAGILDGWRVLDVGSGTGSLAIEIATQRPHCQIVGIEPREDYVAYAKAQGSNTAVQFEVGNAQELPLADAEFAATLSLLLFNFIPHPRKALAERQRVSRPSGQICAATWDYGDWMQMLRHVLGRRNKARRKRSTDRREKHTSVPMRRTQHALEGGWT